MFTENLKYGNYENFNDRCQSELMLFGQKGCYNRQELLRFVGDKQCVHFERLVQMSAYRKSVFLKCNN